MNGVLPAFLLGLGVGAFNYWLLQAVLEGAVSSAVPPSEAVRTPPPAASGPPSDRRRPRGRGLAARMTVRMLTNLGALFVAFVFFRNQWAILAALFGLLIFPTITVFQVFIEGRARRK